MVPPPLAAQAAYSNVCPDPHNTRQALAKLYAGATSAEEASKRYQATLSDVQRLLQDRALTQYKFKKTGPPASSSNEKQPLSAFSSTVLQTSAVPYQYVDSSMQNGSAVKEPEAESQPPQPEKPPENLPIHAPPPVRKPRIKLNPGKRPASVTQKDKDDIMVRNLTSMMQSLFEEEDTLHSGVDTANGSFVAQDSDDTPPVLQLEAQMKLESHVHKVVFSNRFDNIAIASWTRTQKLCEGALTVAGSCNLRIGDDWDEADVHEWLIALSHMEKGLVASRTLLRIMAAGSAVSELQSETRLNLALTVFSNVIESCLVPAVEERPPEGHVKGNSGTFSRFIILSRSRKTLQTLSYTATKSLRVLGEFVSATDLDESCLSTVEYLCKLLIFAENASSDKESAMGIETIEPGRQCAMDVLARIFTRYAAQRQHILQDILTSLEKLPATKQNARHFRLPDARPIQLVSALLMRLVQTSATFEGPMAVHDLNNDVEIDLMTLAKPLHETSQSTAQYIVQMLIQRALVTPKNSDEPHRRLLDIFIEDFLNVIGSSDWPAAEILLRALVSNMIKLTQNSKSTAPVRTVALELLSAIGSGIIGLQTTARNAPRTLESANTKASELLHELLSQYEDDGFEKASLLASDGPYRIVMEYLLSRGADDAQLRSAAGYHLMRWIMSTCESNKSEEWSKSAQKDMRSILADPHWLDVNRYYPTMDTSEGRLAAVIITLDSQLCKAFKAIFSVLLNSLTSEASTVRSRGLKSVALILDRDPSILDRVQSILAHIAVCTSDPSPLVRDSALKLIEDCLKRRPKLDETMCEMLISRTRDSATLVRKRALKMLKDVYLRQDSIRLRSAVAEALIARMSDNEESVADLARQTIVEVWFYPLQKQDLDGSKALEARMELNAQAGLLVKTLDKNDSIRDLLGGFIKDLAVQTKQSASFSAVFEKLVAVLFDGIIDSTDLPETPSQAAIIRCLSVFARACPKLVTAEQLEWLEPYTKNLTKSDDLEVFRAAVMVLRYTLPHQKALKPNALMDLQSSLLTSIAKLPKQELIEAVPCLWTTTTMIGNRDRLVKFISSALVGIDGLRKADLGSNATKFVKLATIVGQFGNACNFEGQLSAFKACLPMYKSDSVPGLMVEILCPFGLPRQPMNVRAVAVEAVCTVARAWPKLFLRPDVVSTMERGFTKTIPALEKVLLTELDEFFMSSEAGESVEPEQETGQERLGKTYVATDQDGASASLAQRFLQPILRSAFSASEDLAWVAAKLVVSINRQGLVHPKECGPALVALETSPVVAISKMAFAEHQAQHTKHESLFDKEYMRAVQLTFDYQQDTFNSPRGFTGQPPAAKLALLWEVLKTARAQVRKRFLGNLVQKLDLTATETGLSERRLAFVQFCVENLVFLDYDKADELQHVIAALERTFSKTGMAIAQAIESEVLRLRIDGQSEAEVETSQLQRLTASAQACSLLWEARSALRNIWNLGKKDSNLKQAAAPKLTPAAAATAEAFLKQSEQLASKISSHEEMKAACEKFVDLVSVDNEVVVSKSDGEENDIDNDDAEVECFPSPAVEGAAARKRKGDGSRTSTPRKKAKASVSPMKPI
ncbi:hypothetical protein K470DRAFT_214347 [Piedraia hortae CBS 480.64]|uniref:Sister chromatid cohesion protein n=1 Tax=Piedraia hortae CBS 480.64 TaxID=1314780 RepID=A0A6A7C341_9PEZI|nr:hypothetical protein K470DRAFT_214347 [Piedraia hortae CBS 480.64]